MRNHIAALLENCSSTVLVISAFVTKIGVSWLHQHVDPGKVQCTVVARWSEADLLSGSSDIEACELAHALGWRFFVLRGLHAKVMLLDDQSMVVGSANLTGAGMSLVPSPNREFGVVAQASGEDVRAAWGMVSDAIEIDPALLSEIKAWISEQGGHLASAQPRFSDSILKKLSPLAHALYTADLPWTSADELLKRMSGAASSDLIGISHDFVLFGLPETALPNQDPRSLIQNAVIRSRCWMWLVDSVRSQPGGQAWFGTVSQLLHDTLLDDPRPYRREVKSLVSNLFSLVAIMDGPLVLDRPNWSERLIFRPDSATG